MRDRDSDTLSTHTFQLVNGSQEEGGEREPQPGGGGQGRGEDNGGGQGVVRDSDQKPRGETGQEK